MERAVVHLFTNPRGNPLLTKHSTIEIPTDYEDTSLLLYNRHGFQHGNEKSCMFLSMISTVLKCVNISWFVHVYTVQL